MGGVILPLLYFFQNVQGMKPVPALLRIVPMVVAAAAASPLVGGLMARRGPRPVILGGLGLIVLGCAVLAFLRPATPYAFVLVALVLIGIGNIAVVTPVTEIVLGSVPAERAGSAAALNNAAMQVGGALGAATLTSVFLDAARADYAARLAPTGLSVDRIREVTRAWRQAVRESASTGAKILPEGMERLFEDAFREAFTVGVARVFAVGALVALVCAVLAWFGLRRARRTPRSRTRRREGRLLTGAPGDAAGWQALAEGYLKTPMARRTAIRMAAPATAMTQPMMGEPPTPSWPASQPPMPAPMIPTMTLATNPIWAFVFMRMLASQPMIPPMIR